MNFIKSKACFSFCLCLFVMAASSCDLIKNNNDKVDDENEGIYEGIYVQGIEDSWFIPCVNLDESWRPLFTETSFEPVWNTLTESESYRIFVKARGTPSKKGEYQGFFAQYDREFEIIEIIETRAFDSGKCH